jgi:hypothetical protein
MVPLTGGEIPNVPADSAEDPNTPILRDCTLKVSLAPLNPLVFLTDRAKGIKREDFLIAHIPPFARRRPLRKSVTSGIDIRRPKPYSNHNPLHFVERDA